MKTLIAVLLVFLGQETLADNPVPGSLCDDVVAASAEDFWTKWDAADLVVYAQPILQSNTAIGIVIVARFAPPMITEEFQLRTLQVWKGPESLPTMDVATAWDFFIEDCGSPPGYCVYQPEACALNFESGVPMVFFLKFVRFRWETYAAFGSGVYDLAWLEAEVGEPVAVEESTWGNIKAQYR
jgi:hypothetical protein